MTDAPNNTPSLPQINISRLDYFTAAALTGLLSNGMSSAPFIGGSDNVKLVNRAYFIAKTMIEESK